jgi:hypothetical protein
MTPESILQQEIRLAIGGRPDCRLFRNVVGTGWVGERVIRPSHAMPVTVQPGDAVIYGARPLYAGLAVGSPDLVGWRRVLITHEHVGRYLAVPVGLEVKSKTGRASVQQLAFIDHMTAFGGLAGVVRSADEAAKVVDAL